MVDYRITKQIGVFGRTFDGWSKEINEVSWGGNAPKYDIRTWGPRKMSDK